MSDGDALTLADLTDTVGFVDPAGSRSPLKRQVARSAIVVVSQDALRRVFVRHSWAETTTTDALIDHIFWTNAQFTLSAFGCEANAMQLLFGETVLREARQRGIRLPLVPVYQSTHQQKPFRIRTALQPVIAEGRLFLRPEDGALRHELVTFPQNPRVDCVDALASAVTLLPKRALAVQQRDDRDALARFLRQSGLSPQQVDGRLSRIAKTPC